MPEQIVVNNEEPRIAIIDNKRAENFCRCEANTIVFYGCVKILGFTPKRTDI